MGKSQRDKGARYERFIAKRLTVALGAEFKRRLGQEREGGHDLENPLYLVPECKRRAKPIAALKWLEQAAAACTEPEHVPIVITRGDNSEDVAVVYLDDLLPILLKAIRWDLLNGG